MKASILSLSCILWVLAAGVSVPRYFEKHAITRRDLTAKQIREELGLRVSNTTLIFGPEACRFEKATSRWTDSSKPDVQVVIEPGIESDVATIVQYCNANSIEFLALNGGHGVAASLSTFSGIQISMRQLDNITIQPGVKSAWFGGGTVVGPVIHHLWDKGFVTTTGGCECVGMLGAGLGGGHGRYEGLYGMISDNMLQLNVVLANGSTIRTNTTSHSDLLWGMKGAGHNFGIVTSYEMNIFPRGPDTWHYHNYIWRGEQLEAVFNALNHFHGNGSTPIDMAFNVGTFLMNASMSEAAYEEFGDVPYSQIAHAQGTGMSDPICQHNGVHISSTAGLQVYNLTAERLIYDGFKKRAIEDPDLAAVTGIMHEGYATAGVEAVDSASSAYPFRADRHLMFFNAAVTHRDSALEERARIWAAEVSDQWNAGEPGRTSNVYLNYATSFETLEERYGHESWRIERLRGLKALYDPNNRFRYYNPIVVE
ncbi:FAD-linked oxidoreductase OXR2 like protein [Verticillium longisporum]|nr:FAD-linked oxidoreductase OXR2 like protein [Verticillium longisporum]